MNPQTVAARQTYTESHFVGREVLVDEYLKRAERLCNGESLRPEERVTVFTGEVGIGKSWLLHHLNTQFAQAFDNQLLLHWFDLPNQSKLPADYDTTRVLIQTLLAFASNILGVAETQRITTIALPELSRQIIEGVRRQLQKQALVIFLDEIYETERSFLELFEEHLLGRLAIEPKVLIMMAGRGRIFPWATPELRFETTIGKLKPFTDDETYDQLKVQRSITERQAAEINRVSGGIPLVNYLLNQNVSLNEIIHRILKPISGEEYAQLRQSLEAICILCFFDDDRIQRLIPAYQAASIQQADSPKTLTHSESVKIRRKLVHAALAQYDKEQSAYVLDEHLRRLLDTYLSEEERRGLWCHLQQTAFTLYEEWHAKYTHNQTHWQAGMDYHQGKLQQGNCV